MMDNLEDKKNNKQAYVEKLGKKLYKLLDMEEYMNDLGTILTRKEIIKYDYLIALNKELNQDEKDLLAYINDLRYNLYNKSTYDYVVNTRYSKKLIEDRVDIYEIRNFRKKKEYIELTNNDFVRFVKEQGIKTVFKEDLYKKPEICSDVLSTMIEVKMIKHTDIRLYEYNKYVKAWRHILEKVDYSIPYKQVYMCKFNNYTLYTIVNTGYNIPKTNCILEYIHSLFKNNLLKYIELLKEHYNE